MAKKNIFQLNDEETALVYLAVQTLVQHGVNHGDLQYAIQSDELRASLRNNISKRLGMTNQEIQEYYEDNARFIASGKWEK